VVIRLLTKLSEAVGVYTAEQKRFTGYFGKLKLAASRKELFVAISDYGRKEVEPPTIRGRKTAKNQRQQEAEEADRVSA
jgi:hypothetical protein